MSCLRILSCTLLVAACAPTPRPSVPSEPWRIEVEPGGTVILRAGPFSPTLRLAYGRMDRPVADADGRVEIDRGEIQESLLPRPDGVEQRWTIRSDDDGHIELSVPVDAVATIDPDGRGATLELRGSRLRYAGLLAWDADHQPLSAWMEPAERGLTVRVDAIGARFPVEVDPTFSLLPWTTDGLPGDGLGTSVASAGDVDGDGFSDLLIGAPWRAGSTPEEGAVSLHLGGPSGPAATASWTWAPQAPFAAPFGRAGRSVASAGDVDGDGLSDVIVGIPGGGASGGGCAALFLGRPTGLPAGPDWSRCSTDPGESLGFSVASGGDLDGDGFSELLIGVPGSDVSGPDAGRVEIFHGGPSGPESEPWIVLAGPQTNSAWGQVVAPAWDVNGDGYGDILVGAPDWDEGPANEVGHAALFLGSASGPGSTPGWEVSGTVAGDRLGSALSGSGDNDGDGYADLIVGLPARQDAAVESGSAWWFAGGPVGPSATPGWTFSVNQPYAHVGGGVAPAGDVDGDGRADLLVGAPLWDGLGGDSGRTWLFRGTPGGPATTAAWSMEGDAAGDRLGAAVASAGDSNGDGRSDVVVAAPDASQGGPGAGRVSSLLAVAPTLASAPAWTEQGTVSGGRIGFGLAGVGDLNHDGYDEVAFGEPGWDGVETDVGRALVQFGGPAGPAGGPDWIWEGDQPGEALGSFLLGPGDVDGDGWDDLLVTAPLRDGAGPDGGRVLLFAGGPAGPSPGPTWAADSSEAGALLGQAGAGGDWNGDGLADFALGAPGSNGVGTQRGQALAWRGSTGGPVQLQWTAEGADDNSRFGVALAGGDVDGDGRWDLAVAQVPPADHPGVASAVHLFAGTESGLDTTAVWQSFQPGPSGFGLGLALGDAHGDGFADLIAGLPGQDRTTLWSGGPSWFAPGWDWESTGLAGSRLGAAAAFVGDIDGDNDADWIVGAPTWDATLPGDGRALLFLGGGSPSITPVWDRGPGLGAAAFGSVLGGPWDGNGDGVGDLLIAAPEAETVAVDGGLVEAWMGGQGDGGADRRGLALRMFQADGSAPLSPPGFARVPGSWDTSALVRTPLGRARATVQVEVEQSGTGFDGSGTVDLSSWVDTGLSGTTIQGTVGRWQELSRFAGRARWVVDPSQAAPLPWGPWSSLGRGPEPLGTQVRTGCSDDLDTDGLCAAVDPDDDNDGDADLVDCAPLDPSVGPSAAESCDEIDQDCDGSLVGSFDNADQDGLPDCVDPDDDGDGVEDAGDCAPLDATIFPSAVESCDALDQDCDGSFVDEFADTDSDGDPDCLDADDDGDGSVDGLDCSPLDPGLFPGAPESCDEIDSDCDGSLTDGEVDSDSDGVPDCVDPDDDADGAEDGFDCAPLEPAIHPGAAEACDFVDSDCDGGLADGDPDTDTDGTPDCVDDDDDGDGSADVLDCDPLDPTIHPGGIENCDTIDSDCDGSWVDEDPDGDGDGTADCIDDDDDGDGTIDGSDCAPWDPAIHPAAAEDCDGLDSDCDGDLVESFPDFDGDLAPDCIDEDDDGDGSEDGSDCAPTDGAVFPGAPELCDGVDNDCDGDLVDAFPDNDLDAAPDCLDDDDDGDGSADAADCAPLDPAIHPGATELCDLLDADCDGALTDGAPDQDADATPDCVDDDDDGDGVLDAGDCRSLDPAFHSGAVELCDAVDHDCDGSIVDEFPDDDGDGVPECVPDADHDGSPDAEDCEPNDPAIFPGAEEVPDDGIDQDCDGDDAAWCWEDGDGDGWGAGEPEPIASGDCGGDGLVDQDGDCDGTESSRHPDATELCDGIDQDCDGVVAEEEDGDADGARICDGDCNDLSPAIHPEAEDRCDGIDQDCDPTTVPGDQDADADGRLGCGGDCDDGDPAVPSASEDCGDDLDTDCDGTEVLGEDPDCWSLGLPGCGSEPTAAVLAILLPLGLGAGRRRGARSLLVLGLLSLSVAEAAAPSSLLDEAKQKMATRQWGGAIATLEAAHRNDPTQDGIWAWKARAYEQLGNGQLAEAMWAAAEEISQGAAAQEAKVGRVHAAELRERSNQAARRRSLLATEGGSGRAAGGVSGMDRGPFVERAKVALKEAHCQVGRAAALEGTIAAPERGEGWRVLGDAELCLGHGREAVSAYRRHLRLGPQDLDVPAILEELGKSLCGLRVRVAGGAQAPVVRVAAEFEEELVLGERGEDLALYFADLPALTEFDIRWAGRGVRPGRMTIGPTEAGAVRTVEITPEVVGVGIIEALGHSPEESAITLLLPEGDVPLLPGERRVVTAGPVPISVHNAVGEVELSLDLPAEGHLRFDPLPWTPARLRVSGAPVGATITASVTGLAKAVRTAKAEANLGMASDTMGPDPATGVFTSEATDLVGLIGGDGDLRIDHPLLGTVDRSFHLDPMQTTELELGWTAMEGLPAVRAAWELHQAERTRLILQRRVGMGAGLGLTVAGAVIAVVGGVLVPQQGTAIRGARSAAIVASGVGDLPEVEAQSVLHHAALAGQEGALVMGLVGGGVAVTGAVLAIALGHDGKLKLARAPGWGPLGEIPVP